MISRWKLPVAAFILLNVFTAGARAQLPEEPPAEPLPAEPVAPAEPSPESEPPAEPVPPPPPPAAAAPESPPPPPSYPIEGEAPPPTVSDPTYDVRRHDGFYLRVGLGLGALRLTRDTETTINDAAYTGSSEIKGLAGVAEISIGGTVGQGIVLCGTLLGHELRNATLETDDRGDFELEQSLSFGLIGMGVHYYPDPLGGFHVGGTLGFAYALAEVPMSRFEQLGGAGVGLSAAVGYDWWVADQWALGVFGRITAARLHGEATSEGVTATEDDTASAIAVMFSVLHH